MEGWTFDAGAAEVGDDKHYRYLFSLAYGDMRAEDQFGAGVRRWLSPPALRRVVNGGSAFRRSIQLCIFSDLVRGYDTVRPVR